jgi:hypothetical protein
VAGGRTDVDRRIDHQVGTQIEHAVTTESPADFVRVCRENRTTIEEVLKEPMRLDLEENPLSR